MPPAPLVPLTLPVPAASVHTLRAVFSLASKLAPCVVFVDEVDALLGRRNSTKEHEALRCVLLAGGGACLGRAGGARRRAT